MIVLLLIFGFGVIVGAAWSDAANADREEARLDALRGKPRR